MKNLRPFFPSKTLAILLLGAVQLTAPAFAQSTPDNEDLRALRFYVENNEQSSIDAEVRRLKAAFPGWSPPADMSNLMQLQPTKEVADIYARLARGDIEGVRRVMQSTKARYPSWEPPADLARQIDVVEAQNEFDRAVNTRNADEALRIGKRVPSLFRCDRINNAWNLAELQTASGNPSRALAAYNQTVRTCTTIPDIVATIEKADTVTSEAQLNNLVDVAKQRFPAHSAKFNALNERLLAGRGVRPAAAIAAAPVAPAVATKAAPAPVPRAAEPVVERQSVVAQPSSSPSLSSLPRTGDSRLGQTRAAKDANRFDDCLALSAGPRSLDLAYERAWCAYNMDRTLESMAYFSAAAQAGLGGTVTRDAQFGLTLSMLKQNMTEDAANISARTNFSDQQRREIDVIILDQRGISAYNKKDYAAAVEYFDALEQAKGSLRRDLAILRGYAYLNLGDKDSARAQFQALHDVLATKESAAGLKASY